jgi:hypothetical protein
MNNRRAKLGAALIREIYGADLPSKALSERMQRIRNSPWTAPLSTAIEPESDEMVNTQPEFPLC